MLYLKRSNHVLLHDTEQDGEYESAVAESRFGSTSPVAFWYELFSDSATQSTRNPLGASLPALL